MGAKQSNKESIITANKNSIDNLKQKQINKNLDLEEESPKTILDILYILKDPDSYIKLNFVTNSYNINISEIHKTKNSPYFTTIKINIANYMKLYEQKIHKFNTIKNKAVKDIKQIYPLIKNLRENFSIYKKNRVKSIKDIQILIQNKKEKLIRNNFKRITVDNNQNFITEKNNALKEIDNFFEDASQYYDEFSEITMFYSKKINKLIEDSFLLLKLIQELSNLIDKSLHNFCYKCDWLSQYDIMNKKSLDNFFTSLQEPINKWDELEKKIEEIKNVSIKEVLELQNKIEDIKKELDEMEKKIKNKLNEIIKNVNKINEKYGGKKELSNELNLKEFTENVKIIKEELRMDLLFIMDLSDSMENYLDYMKNQIPEFINKLKKECPEVDIYFGLIGYKGSSYLNYEEKNVNIELTKNYENIIQQLKFLQVEGNGGNLKDFSCALELAYKKEWKGKSRFAILFTNSSCYEKKYYNDKIDNNDNYQEINRLNRNINDYIQFFAENEISFLCSRIDGYTDKMFFIFEDIYNSNKEINAKNDFLADESENIFNFVISNTIETFQN